MAEPVLFMAKACDGGLLPPADIEKLREVGEATKPGSPTTTLTGIVTPSPVAAKNTWPMYVPATRPPFGRFAGLIDTVTDEGAVPCAGETPSQLPLSAVLLTERQVSVPVPPFRSSTTWFGGAPPPVLIKKPNWPITLSKKAPLAATVSVIGIVIDMFRVG